MRKSFVGLTLGALAVLGGGGKLYLDHARVRDVVRKADTVALELGVNSLEASRSRGDVLRGGLSEELLRRTWEYEGDKLDIYSYPKWFKPGREVIVRYDDEDVFTNVGDSDIFKRGEWEKELASLYDSVE